MSQLISAANCIVYGNTSSGNALNVQQLGAGNVLSIKTSSGSTALFVGANGNVGVGTANPGGTFNVLSGNAGFPDTSGSGTSNVAARIQSGSICLDFGSIGGTNPFWIQNHLNTAWNTTYPLLLNPNGGNVGVGTTNPGYALDVSGSARVNVGTSNVIIGAGQGAGQGGLFMIPQSSIAGSSWNLGCGLQGSYANAITFTSGTNVGIGTTNPSSYTLQVSGTIGATGDITAYFSDERLKTKTGRIESALEKVLSLEAFTYVPNDLAKSFGFEDSKQRVGLSAQSVQRVLPEAVCPAPFDADNKSGQQYLTVQYDKLVPLLVEAIKELAGR